MIHSNRIAKRGDRYELLATMRPQPLARFANWNKRLGSATVELAVGLPVLFLLILGTAKVCDVIFMKQRMQLAAYRAARTAIADDATNELVRQAATEVLATKRITDFEITTVPADISQVERGQSVKVSIAINRPFNSSIVDMSNGINVSTTMIKE